MVKIIFLMALGTDIKINFIESSSLEKIVHFSCFFKFLRTIIVFKNLLIKEDLELFKQI